MPDIGASVIARLKNKAMESGRSLQLYMQLFCQEEFLRRLALSAYADHLVLKGGLFIYSLTNFESRTTIDVDFLLRQLPSDIENVRRIVDDILNTKSGHDFITFESDGFETISLHRKYKGISFRIIGKIRNTKTPFKVDIGVGDVIVPKADKRCIPVQLPEFTRPEISTYSLESTIAEKLDAILQRLELTSRMKDFYDIWYLSITFNFDGQKLQDAIEQTFHNRGTSIDRESLNKVISLSEHDGIQRNWRQFILRMKLPAVEFSDVTRVIHLFLLPVCEAITHESQCLATWSASELGWR